MSRAYLKRVGGRIFILFAVAILVCSCASGDKEVIKKQREGLIYPVSYQKAFQCAMFTLTKKGITIRQIDKENGLITTLPHQIREEKYVYQIAIRPVDEAKTAISVICTWGVSSGIDVAYAGIPSAVARSKSKKLEIELADEIGKEIMKPQIEKPHLKSSLEKVSKLPPFLGAAKSLALKDARGGPFYVWSSMGVYIGEEKVFEPYISYDRETKLLMLVTEQGNIKKVIGCWEDKNMCLIAGPGFGPKYVTFEEAEDFAYIFFKEIDRYGLW